MGNPGAAYAVTRHNAGFLLADRLADAWKLPGFRRHGPGRVTSGAWSGVQVGLVKPTTFMNLSGRVIPLLLNEPGFEFTRDLLIAVDDAAIPLGTFRLRARGSAGGHNGLKSIEAALQSQEYARLRIGVGPAPEDGDDLSEFVLAPFAPEELALLETRWSVMVDAVGCWVRDGIDEAMTQYNHLGNQTE